MEPELSFVEPGWWCPGCEEPRPGLIEAWHELCYVEVHGPIPTTEEYEASGGTAPEEQ